MATTLKNLAGLYYAQVTQRGHIGKAMGVGRIFCRGQIYIRVQHAGVGRFGVPIRAMLLIVRFFHLLL